MTRDEKFRLAMMLLINPAEMEQTLSSLFLLLVLMASSLSEQDSPINKLLYARDIPRYKQMVERWAQVSVTFKTDSKR